MNFDDSARRLLGYEFEVPLENSVVETAQWLIQKKFIGDKFKNKKNQVWECLIKRIAFKFIFLKLLKKILS